VVGLPFAIGPFVNLNSIFGTKGSTTDLLWLVVVSLVTTLTLVVGAAITFKHRRREVVWGV
jgi:hypothetical protein